LAVSERPRKKARGEGKNRTPDLEVRHPPSKASVGREGTIPVNAFGSGSGPDEQKKKEASPRRPVREEGKEGRLSTG